MEVIARFKIGIWCMDLDHVDKAARNKYSVIYPLFCEDVSDRTVDVRGMQTKDSSETVRA